MVYSNTPIEQRMRSYYTILVMYFRMNVKIVVSYIGETFLEDERSQARLGGLRSCYIPASGLLVFYIYIYIYIYMYICFTFSHKLF